MIRRDLFAVMTETPEGKTFHYIGKDPQAARNQAALFNGNHQRSYPLIEATIVHPSQKIVDFYVAAGNQIN